MVNEYIRKHDAIDELRKDVMGGLNYESIIDSLPPADVVRVVRCQNCKHHTYDEIFASFWCEYPGRVRDTTPDGFCEKGEE